MDDPAASGAAPCSPALASDRVERALGWLLAVPVPDPGRPPRGLFEAVEELIRAGAPVLALPGTVMADTVSSGRVALLSWVPSTPLTGVAVGEQQLIGETLARVHRILRDQAVPGAQRFDGSARPDTSVNRE